MTEGKTIRSDPLTTDQWTGGTDWQSDQRNSFTLGIFSEYKDCEIARGDWPTTGRRQWLTEKGISNSYNSSIFKINVFCDRVTISETIALHQQDTVILINLFFLSLFSYLLLPPLRFAFDQLSAFISRSFLSPFSMVLLTLSRALLFRKLAE